MKIETKFNIFDYVKIKGLDNIIGRVMSIKVDWGDKLVYEVEYYANSESKVVWLLDDEMEFKSKIEDKQLKISVTNREGLKKFILDGLSTDGSYHKQWYLEQLLVELGFDVNEIKKEYEKKEGCSWDEGTAP